MQRVVRGGSWGLLAVLLLTLVACAGRRPEVQRSDEELLDRAERNVARREYEDARKDLQRLIQQYPESPLVPDARLLLAQAYFRDKKFDEARSEYQKFLELFPQHERADEAHYYMGLAYFTQLSGVDRDITFAQRALDEFRTVLEKMPDSAFIQEAATKAVICRRMLAEKELYIGRFYYRRDHFAAAAARFQAILDTYPGAGLDDQALYWLGRSLAALEQSAEARDAYQRLLAQFPDSGLAPAAARELGVPWQGSQARPKTNGGAGLWERIRRLLVHQQ